MRILHVCALMDGTSGGGLAERTLQFCRALAQAGADNAVLTLDIGLDARRRGELAGIELQVLPSRGRRFPLPWGGFSALRRAVAGADLVLITGHWTLLNALAWRAARSAAKPYVFCPAGALSITGRSPLLKRVYNFVVGRRIVREAAGHVAVTVGELPQFGAYGIAPDRVVVIPNGVAAPSEPGPDCADCAAVGGLPSGRFVLFMGRLGYIKGPDLLLEAFARVADALPHIDLVLAGPDAGMLDGLRAAAQRLGVAGRVHFAGHLDGAAKDCAYRRCEFLAVPSRKEAMSLVALEAGIRGKPVLLTDQCGFDEVGACGGGLVVGAASGALAQGLAAMAGDGAGCRQMGATLRDYIGARYTWDRSAALFLRHFGGLAR